MVGTLTMTLAAMYENPQIAHLPAPLAIDQLRDEILADEHVAHLGAQLFSTYLVPVEVGGTLLLVALVGAVAIVAQIRKPSLEKG
jgi:NADH:ubiquinone oxidoreductase subunit 6 (subunit J)